MIEKYQAVRAEDQSPIARSDHGELKKYVAFPLTVETATSTTFERRMAKPNQVAHLDAKSLKGVELGDDGVKTVFGESKSRVVDPTLRAVSEQEFVNMKVWLDNPIVKAAARRQRLPNIRSLFISLHSVLHDLEDRFPGVSFRELLSGSSGGRPDNFIESLAEAGCDVDDIAIVAAHTGCEPNAINIDEPSSNPERLKFELADDIVAERFVDRSKWNKEDWARAHAMPTPMSDSQRRVCAAVLEDQFRTMKSIAAELQISPSTVRQTIIKLRYHRSRRLHEWSEE